MTSRRLIPLEWALTAWMVLGQVSARGESSHEVRDEQDRLLSTQPMIRTNTDRRVVYIEPVGSCETG